MRHVNLCFHGIGTPERELEPGEEDYWISQETFLAVLDDVAQHRDAVVSFDDGNASDVEIGLPALVERDLRATFFVLAGRLDAPGCLSSADLGFGKIDCNEARFGKARGERKDVSAGGAAEFQHTRPLDRRWFDGPAQKRGVGG